MTHTQLRSTTTAVLLAGWMALTDPGLARADEESPSSVRVSPPAPAVPELSRARQLPTDSVVTAWTTDPVAQRYQSAKDLRLTGIIFVAAAAANALVGTAVYASAKPGNEADLGKAVFGLGFLIAAPIALVPGAVMWGVGQARMERVRPLLQPTLGSAPAGSLGAGLHWRF